MTDFKVKVDIRHEGTPAWLWCLGTEHEDLLMGTGGFMRVEHAEADARAFVEKLNIATLTTVVRNTGNWKDAVIKAGLWRDAVSYSENILLVDETTGWGWFGRVIFEGPQAAEATSVGYKENHQDVTKQLEPLMLDNKVVIDYISVDADTPYRG